MDRAIGAAGAQRMSRSQPDSAAAAELDQADGGGNGLRGAFARLRADLRGRIVGQEALIERLLIALLAEGHLLVEGCGW
jgi:MoxR-like ATPase